MKVSRTWLQKYFDAPLPAVEDIAQTLTFHSSEVEEIVGEMLDVKVLPDRACYALSHRGIAYELSAALNQPLKDDPLAAPLPELPQGDAITVSVCDGNLVPRFSAAVVKGVAVGPSPAWLREALESVGQRSINNVVDATNYVMLNLGQPVHAFDASKLTDKEGYKLTVRQAYEGEKITTLTGEEYVLPEGTLLVVDGHTDTPVGIAGVNGGNAAEVNQGTTDLVVEVANFDGTQIRRAAQALKLWTDASLRFQNRISPELVGYGMRDVLALITQVAGGEVVSVADAYPNPDAPALVSVTTERINGVLGTSYSAEEMKDALDRLALTHTQEGTHFHVQVPFIRRDLVRAEDLAEEVGRILGYEHVPVTELPPVTEAPDQRRYRGLERIRDILVGRGYVEVSTQSFSETGEVELANPLQNDRPWLRASLTENMREALTRAKREAPRVLGPEPSLKLFELGTVFPLEGEHLSLALGYEPFTGKASKLVLDDDIAALIEALPGAGLTAPSHDGQVAELSLAAVDLEGIGEGYEPESLHLGVYHPFSAYPFALRDIAVWTPEGTTESEVALLIHKEAGELLVRMDLFDRFDKEERTSYAFRLVFQANDRTLSDADLDPVMAKITETLNAQPDFEVR